ncbi:IclR family transcriptional regulator [Rhodococcus sp. MEB032]|uniref:IclR family transcriptional regulator n=1 Tax=Rhodococcus sp. MEB032 TaxID=3040322 RepID=UPI002551040F|nr:IclR family transcriptional regulator [Rhodococcus sp. MEB032]
MDVGLTDKRLHNSSIDRTLAIFDAFTSGNTSGPLRIAQVSERTGMPKSTVHRLLAAMVAHGYVAKSGIHYRLAERTFELGSRAQVGRIRDLRATASPYIADLFTATRQTIHLAVLSGTEVLYLEKLSGLSAHPHIPTRAGSRRPAHATAVGKALIAFGEEDARISMSGHLPRLTAYTISNSIGMRQSISRIRDSGIAIDNEESFLGITCIAAPVMDPASGSAVAAISIVGSVSGTHPVRHKAALVRTAEQLSTALRAQPGVPADTNPVPPRPAARSVQTVPAPTRP